VSIVIKEEEEEDEAGDPSLAGTSTEPTNQQKKKFRKVIHVGGH
jgi:hypothetical protein